MSKTADKANVHKYKMADLMSMTGFRRETIHFYISEGLLPPSKKTSRNMAWYSDEHIELLKNIKKLQQEKFLPLKAIKTILRGSPDYKFSHKQAEFLSVIRERIEHPEDESQTKHKRGSIKRVSDSDRAELQQMGWIESVSPPYSENDKKVLKLWDRVLDHGVSDVPGVSPIAFDYLMKSVDDFLEGNIEFFKNYMADNVDQEQAAAMAVGAIPVFTELFSVLYEKRLRKFAENFAQEEKPSKKPSKRSRPRVNSSRKKQSL